MTTSDPRPVTTQRITLDTLRGMKAAGRKIAMLTAYDYPTAALAQAAGIHMLLIGDSLATVLLGHENTRAAPLEVMLTLAAAVRRGAPDVYFVGDLPYEAVVGGNTSALNAALRFRDEAGCDAVKFEAGPAHDELVTRMSAADLQVIVHLGLQPQQVLRPDGYRAQARDLASIRALVALARRMADSGAAMLLLEAVPNEAAAEVVAAVDVPVIGCGAGPACDGHVVVTQDMLGLTDIRPPRFVPVLARLRELCLAAMERYVQDIVAGNYPQAQHVYPMRTADHPPPE